MLPPEADAFQDRGAADALDVAVAGGGTAVLCQVLAGTAGSARPSWPPHYARRSWQAEAVELLVWVTAAVVSAYAQAGIDVADADPDEPEQAAGRLLSWLDTTDRPVAGGSG